MAQYNIDGMAKGLIFGFIAGSVVGAVLALLYAPKTGKEFRADLKERAGDLADEAQEYLSRAKTKAVEIINDGKRKSDSLISDARKRADSIMGDAEKIMTEARAKNSGEGQRPA
jgi:gas vesicle protein